MGIETHLVASVIRPATYVDRYEAALREWFGIPEGEDAEFEDDTLDRLRSDEIERARNNTNDSTILTLSWINQARAAAVGSRAQFTFRDTLQVPQPLDRPYIELGQEESIGVISTIRQIGRKG